MGIFDIIQRAVVQGIPLLFGCVGETITEKSGNLNLGTPGTMYVGAICGVIGGFFYENAAGDNINGFLAILIPTLCCIIGSLLMGLIFSFLTISLRANQNVTGLALTTFGIGIGNFFGGSLIKIVNADVPTIVLSNTSYYFKLGSGLGDNLGWFGQVFLSYSWLAWLGIIIAVASGIVLKKTRTGLYLRAVGESPATADAAGISVTKYKYLATCLGSVIAGLGGLYYIMDYASGVWSADAFGDRGWLAVALVIFTLWSPLKSIWASILFGGLYILHIFLPVGSDLAVKELYKIIPYIITIIVLVITSLRNKKEDQPPASLGLPYFREDR